MGKPVVQAFKITTEDWSPSYKLDCYKGEQVLLLDVKLYKLNDNTYRICIWGADDTGLEKDITHSNQLFAEMNSRALFDEVIGLEVLTWDDLVRNHRFTRA